jgi:integrase
MNEIDLGLIVDRWLSSKATNTQLAYRRDLSYLENYLRQHHTEILKISEEQAEAYAASLRAADRANGRVISQATITRRLRVMRSFFKFAYESGVIAVDPTKKIAPKPDDRVCDRMVSSEKINAVLDVGAMTSTLAKVLGDTDEGLTILDVTQIRWCDFFFSALGDRGLYVRAAGGKVKAVSPQVWEALVRWREINKAGYNEKVFWLTAKEVRALFSAAA